jgi:hypothetical protein
MSVPIEAGAILAKAHSLKNVLLIPGAVVMIAFQIDGVERPRYRQHLKC